MSVPGGKHFFAWEEWYRENSRLLAKLRQAAKAMANMPVKKCYNAWHQTIEDEKEAKRKLTEAVRMIINSKAAKAFGGWAETCAIANAKKEKLRAALAGMSPEGRAKKSVIRKIAWIRKRKLAMAKALNGFRLAGCKAFIVKMQEHLEKMQKLRKGGAALFNRKARAAFSTWAEQALKGAGRAKKLEAALRRMSPEGRALVAGFNAWAELLFEIQNLRRAASGFVNASEKKAMTAWIEATFAVSARTPICKTTTPAPFCTHSHPPAPFSLLAHIHSFSFLSSLPQAFHISTGLDGFTKWVLRKGLRKWVGRAGVRRGLRKQVFTSAIKGKDVLRLMAMADEADTDDLSNAIMAKDAEGSTPMLIAAKRGHLDVVEMLITSMARCGEELHDASLLPLVLSTADAQGNSCLHWAARKGHLDVARSLLEAGSNVDAKNLEEATPLHWAARKNNVELMQILLSVGCDTTIQNKWGATAIEQAASFGQQEAVQLIQQTEIKRQSSPNKRSKQQQSGGGGGASGGASGKAAASSGVSPPSMPKQPAWGEGPGMSAFVRSRQPPKIREQLERRREAAEKRRQEAYNMRIEQSRQAAADQLIRRKRQQLEIDMKELMEKIDGPITKYEASYISKAGPAIGGAPPRDHSRRLKRR